MLMFSDGNKDYLVLSALYIFKMVVINLRAYLYSDSLPKFVGVDKRLVPIVHVFDALGVNILDLQKQSVPISKMWHSQKRRNNGLIILKNYHLLTYMNK